MEGWVKRILVAILIPIDGMKMIIIEIKRIRTDDIYQSNDSGLA